MSYLEEKNIIVNNKTILNHNGRDRFSSGDFRISGYMEELPGNCAVCLISNLSVNFDNIILICDILKALINFASDCGYTSVIYTTENSQTNIINALKKLEFESISNFTSRRTGNKIRIWQYIIEDDYDED